MPKVMGRNPFEKRKIKTESKATRSKVRVESPSKERFSRWSEVAFIQVPAQSMLFALRAVLRIKGFLEKS